MKINTAIKYFGGGADGVKALTEALGITQHALYMWRGRGDQVPKCIALELHYITDGALRYNPRNYASKPKLKKTSGRSGTSPSPTANAA